MCSSLHSTFRGLCTLSLVFAALGLAVSGTPGAKPLPSSVQINNDRIRCTVAFRGGLLASETITGSHHALVSDGGFALDVMWTDWRAPGKASNADNELQLTQKDYHIEGVEERALPDGIKELSLFFTAPENPLHVLLTYRLSPGASYVRRKLSVIDTTVGRHYLERLWPRWTTISGSYHVVHRGGFGQPIACVGSGDGFFAGLEYPAGENRLTEKSPNQWQIACGQEVGARVSGTWIESNWTVLALSPDTHLKKRFMEYLDDIRVAPLKPYALYNSWYDLRSADYPKVPPGNVMNEENVLRMVQLIRTNMIERYGITLDAFVLDDGWDVYKSDWVLRPVQFPRGLRPVADALHSTGTALGIWIGPTGGYSFHNDRIGWMREHGYEIVGDQLCIGGKTYSQLFKKRATDFVRHDGVSYFKWDGIQFSCSEPDHGHPIGVASRRAILDSLIAMCTAVRRENPAMFLNITSGTWLSPWWLTYANQIWMDGADYGFADVPSLFKRDAAITYRDFVLYEDFSLKGLWFPISNLMTHGIIKGKLQLLGSADEPLDKFTEDVLLYFARGVSMYELYISPDILSEGEWHAIAASLSWARDRFPVLRHSEMIGGNPMARETYGYAHFAGNHGILACRNPSVTPSHLKVKLDAAQGLASGARRLVLERVFPTRMIAPRLYAEGETLTVPLGGFATEVYELYPLDEATMPLVAGVPFSVDAASGNEIRLTVDGTQRPHLLNPESVDSVSGASVQSHMQMPSPIALGKAAKKGENGSVQFNFTLHDSARATLLAFLLTPDSICGDKPLLPPHLFLDGNVRPLSEGEKGGRSRWYTASVAPGAHAGILQLGGDPGWSGRVAVWIVGRAYHPTTSITLKTKAPVAGARVYPPVAWSVNAPRENVFIGESSIRISGKETPR
jgi:hypothetical protein